MTDRWKLFEAWLEREDYAESTIIVTVSDVKYACSLAREGQGLPWRLRDRVARALRWPRHRWTPDELDAFTELVEREPPKRQSKKKVAQARKQRREISMADEDWRRFVTFLAQSEDPKDAVLYVMSATGLRVGDVLRLTRQRIAGGLKTGRIRLVAKGGDERILPVAGAPQAWEKLSEAVKGSESVALAVAPGGDGSPIAGDAAYRAVVRRLAAVGRKLEIEGKLHTHRLRRTVAVQTLRLTGSAEMTRRMLGSKSLGAIRPYIDESRPEELAEMQRAMREKFGASE